ncbi:hypothetical protein [Coprobacter fastidiosus]|uniref:hypothetical protein n=1 Tax=Coprobacter fastidiosus TaxID=1099853 RepID=UPI00266F8642|nr:hypothetical protein [Coprobacter fastidiosus]
MSNKIRNTILVISALFILAGTALYLFRLPFTVYIFAAGAVGMTVARATNLYNGSNFRLKRLYRIELIVAIVTVGSAWFMFKQQNEWILLLLVAAFLQLYTSFMIPRVEKNGK